MANTRMKVEEIPSEDNHSRYTSEQPIDRHTIEITDKHITVFINGGIDSTCGKKRAEIIHTLTNGTVTSTDIANANSNHMVNLIDQLDLQSSDRLESSEDASTSMDGSDSYNSQCCTHCGK